MALSRAVLIISCSLGITAVTPAWAHKVQVAEDIGATMHIEPDDVAIAGTPTEVWFALTKAGGIVVPLADCDCRLTLYDSQENVVSTPELSPVAAENYVDIPGATVSFPTVGAYQLLLEGSPAAEATFSPFALSFEVTVAQGTNTAVSAETQDPPAAESEAEAAAATPQPEPDVSTAETSQADSTSQGWRPVGLGAAAILAVGLVWGVLQGLRSPGGDA